MARRHIEKQKNTAIQLNPYMVNAVAPGYLAFHHNHCVVDNSYAKMTMLDKFKESQRVGWGESFLGLKYLHSPITFVCTPCSTDEIERRVNFSVKSAGPQIGDGMLTYTEKQKKIHEAEHAGEIGSMLIRDNTQMFTTQVYAMMRGDDLEKISVDEEYLESSVFQGSGNHTKPIWDNQEAMFWAASPFLLDDDEAMRQRPYTMPAETITWAQFDSTYGIDHMRGIELGTDKQDGINRFDVERIDDEHQNYNVSINGETGSGKSTIAKHIAMTENLIYGAMVLVLGDPESEWGHLALGLGGEVKRIGEVMFSPFEPRNMGSDELTRDEMNEVFAGANDEVAEAFAQAQRSYVLAMTIPPLITFLRMAFPSIEGRLVDYLRYAVEKLYADYGITSDTTFEQYYAGPQEYPIMSELYDKLIEIAEEEPADRDAYQRLAMAIRPAAYGHLKHLWNSRTKFETHTSFVVIDTSLIADDDDLKRAQYYNIFTWAWSQIRAERFSGRFVRVVVEELHTIMNKNNKDAALQVRNIALRIRKYFGGLMTITPNAADLLADDIRDCGQAILYNSCYSFFGKTSGKEPGGNLYEIQRLLSLTDSTRDELGESGKKTFLVRAGSREKGWLVTKELPQWELELFGKGGGK